MGTHMPQQKRRSTQQHFKHHTQLLSTTAVVENARVLCRAKTKINTKLDVPSLRVAMPRTASLALGHIKDSANIARDADGCSLVTFVMRRRGFGRRRFWKYDRQEHQQALANELGIPHAHSLPICHAAARDRCDCARHVSSIACAPYSVCIVVSVHAVPSPLSNHGAVVAVCTQA